MPKLDVSVSHRLSREEAAGRIKRLLGQMKEQYGENVKDLEEDWSRDSCRFSFSVMGSRITGYLDILNTEVRISGDLPFAASLFKGKIEETIKEKAEELLR